jgi:AAA+ ATPase superfamily predicted ATPase
MAEIIGRKEELEVLKTAATSKEAELVALYGRRRIGKTYLIRNFYQDQIAFELTGLHNGSLRDQLLLFSKALQVATKAPLPRQLGGSLLCPGADACKPEQTEKVGAVFRRVSLAQQPEVRLSGSF